MANHLVALRSIYAALVASFVALRFFPDIAVLGASAIVAISLRLTIDILLEQNRRAIWEEKTAPWHANSVLATQIIIIFFSIFFIFGGMGLYVNVPAPVEDVRRFNFNFSSLLLHNVSVLASGFVLSVLLSAGGLLLILAWNACHWALSIVQFLSQSATLQSSSVAVKTALAYAPHLFLEVVSYILAGLAGVFLGKAILKYSPLSNEFRRVSVACIAIIAIALVILVIATYSEVYVAAPNIRTLQSVL